MIYKSYLSNFVLKLVNRFDFFLLFYENPDCSMLLSFQYCDSLKEEKKILIYWDFWQF